MFSTNSSLLEIIYKPRTEIVQEEEKKGAKKKRVVEKDRRAEQRLRKKRREIEIQGNDTERETEGGGE